MPLTPAHHFCPTENDMEKIAALYASTAETGDIFLLSGTLGAGKSTFARAFIKSLCGQTQEVPSPTFTLLQTYESPKGPIWHFDLYRLNKAEEIYEIGWEEGLGEAIFLIEWPERADSLLRPPYTKMNFMITENNSRVIEVCHHAI